MDFSFSFKKPPSGSQAKKANPFEQAEEQFNAIRGCGVTPRPAVTFAQLTEGQDPAAFEGAPYAHMLCVMAGTGSDGEPFSDDVLLVNPQCISESGSYSALITSVMRLAKGALPFEDLADSYDGDNNVASITFTLDSEGQQWDVAVEDNGVAPEVWSNLATIAASRADSGERLAWCEVDGQRLMVFLSESDLSDLAQTTGMEWAAIE
ncbi:MAG TPA: hypothetical protein VD997_10150 [Phycisphaerales bacterium]|nr:hypothetical protein [Phycisphaerales bacterium]